MHQTHLWTVDACSDLCRQYQLSPSTTVLDKPAPPTFYVHCVALLEPQTNSILIRTCRPYTGNLNSETSGNSENAKNTLWRCFRSWLLLQVDTQRSKQWGSVIKASVQVLQQQLALHPETGLLADFLVYNKSEKRYKPSKGKILERDSDGDFGYNACRFV